MKNLNEYASYINESMIDQSHEVSLNPMELLALYAMIDATDTSKTMQKTKHKIEMSLRSHITYILRECHDLGNHYTYKSIFEPKSKEEADNLLDIIISEIEYRERNKKGTH